MFYLCCIIKDLKSILSENLQLSHQFNTRSITVPEEVTSVYVRNLPADITEAEIDQEFKNFGRIKPDGIFVRVKQVTPHYIKLNDYSLNKEKRKI